MPPEVLRYFVVRSRADKTLYFDSGLGLFKLIDEYAEIKNSKEHEFKDAYLFASQVNRDEHEVEVISSIPFAHLVAVYQAARGDVAATRKLLERTGYEKEASEQFSILEREFEFVKNWLAKYAPESVKFAVQKALPKVDLSEDQRTFLAALAKELEPAGELDGSAMHSLIYQAKDQAELTPAEAFQALYRVILGKDSGPKAGWFLASLDRGWLVKRLKIEA
jgi:lysyl-tRNA synthetase class 1